MNLHSLILTEMNDFSKINNNNNNNKNKHDVQNIKPESVG